MFFTTRSFGFRLQHNMIDSLRHCQTSCCSTNIAVATWRITFWLTPGILYTSQWSGRCPHNAFFPGGSRPPPNTRFLGSTRVHIPNGSAVLAQIIVVTNGHRHRHSPRYICSNRPNNNCRCRALCSSCIIVVVIIIIIIHFISGSKAHKNAASKKTEID